MRCLRCVWMMADRATNGSAMYIYQVGSASDPVPSDDRPMKSLLRRVEEQGRAHPGFRMLSGEGDRSLHLSLTRPILIRKHEQKSFVDQAAQCVRESQVERYVARLTQLLGRLCALYELSERHFGSRLFGTGDECGMARGTCQD